MNVHARARASAQAIDRSATRLDPVAGLDDLLGRRRRQPLQRAAAAALALLVVAVAIWAGAVLRGPTPIQPTLGPVTRIRVGSVPVSVAVTPDAAWVLNSGDSTISRIDPGTGQVRSSVLVSGPAGPRGGMAFATVAEERLWVVHASGWDSSAISVIDPPTGRTLNTFGVGGAALSSIGTPGNLAIGAGAVWAALHGEDGVQRYDSATGALLDRFPLPEPTALAVDGQTVWVASVDGRLRSIDTDTDAVRVRATTELVTRIQVGQGGMWLMTFDGKVLRLDRRTGRIVA